MNNTIPRSSIPRNNPVSRLSGAPEKPPKRYYYMNDGKRNITSLRSQQEGICATYTYGTFGQKLEETGEIAKTNPFRYSSEYHDDDLGLIYYNYRHYNPKDGRWLSPDPKQEEGGVNLYAFCANNPTSRIDNLGLDSEMAGASKTGFSAHWGNIVRGGVAWATVCYKYYKPAYYMGYLGINQIWEELADATKLNSEERKRWVRNYTPSPEPGTHFYIPNTFCIYKAKFENPDEATSGSTMDHLRTKLDAIKERFLKSGVNIIEKKDLWDEEIFVSLWKEKGIFGIGFTGHGDPLAFGARGEKDWGTSPLNIERAGISYNLAIIVAYNCVSLKVGWQQFLSRSGKIYGFDYYYSKMKDDLQKGYDILTLPLTSIAMSLLASLFR